MMKTAKTILATAGVVLFSLMVSSAQPAVTLTTLVSFNGTNGAGPRGGLVLGKDGNFYGTTESGGTNVTTPTSGFGTIFRLASDRTLTTLASFDETNGYSPIAQLTQDAQGSLYGSTVCGGTNNYLDGSQAGNIFQLATTGDLQSLLSFDVTNGAYPEVPLLSGKDGNFYGTTRIGGSNINPDSGRGYGTIFQITPTGTLTTLVEFNGTNGGEPAGRLVAGNDGNFYGTTSIGGANGCGTIFQLATNGVITTIADFNGTNGAGPCGGLLQGPDGSFYGTTQFGGTNINQGYLGIKVGTNFVLGYGTVFRLAPDGALFTLACLGGTSGAYPIGDLLLGRDGNLYGTTSGLFPSLTGEGTIFQLTMSGSFATLLSFNETNGALPYGGLVNGPDGNLYGTTEGGGAYGKGTVFRLTVPMTPVLQPVASSGGQFVFSWNSVAGLNYQVQYSADITSTNWANMGSVITAVSGTTFQTNAIAGTQGFYRVLLVP